jgi:adenylate kinase
MRKFVIMGIRGSGKGTHAKMLAGGFDLEHIAVGDIFRWNVQHHTKLGAQVRRTMAAGLLVGDDLVDSVVKQRLSEHDWNYGFIIDGFPRNERQAEFFLEYVITVNSRPGKEQVQQAIRDTLGLAR